VAIYRQSAIELIRAMSKESKMEKLNNSLEPSLPPAGEQSAREAEAEMSKAEKIVEPKKARAKPAKREKVAEVVRRLYVDTGKHPDALVLAKDDTDPLWDPRQELKLDRDFVLNVAERGIKVPIRAWEEAGKYRVVDGRQRARAVPEANKWRREHKLPPLVVPVDVVPHDASLESALSAMEEGSELNEYRIDSDPVTKAQIISRHLDMNRTEAEVGKMMRMSTAMVQAHLVLLRLPKKIQELVRESRMSVTTAAKLAGQSPAELVRTAEKIVALSSEGRVTASRAKSAAGEDAGPARLTAKKIVQFIAELKKADLAGKHGEAVARGAVLALETVLDARKLERVWEKFHEAAK
jgi:hypothetical protein